MTATKITLLGGLEIDAGTEAKTVSLTRKARGLVAYLALRHGKPQSREKLADLLWGGSAEEQARANLRQTLSTVQKILNDHLIADGDQFAIAPSAIELDVTRFEQLAANGDAAALEQAAALYGGDLLDGFSLKEEAFEAWVRPERERLRTVATETLTKLAAYCEEVQDYERCAQAANRLLALDPLREDAHRALMRAYAAQGRESEALKQFEACRDKLRRELDVAPQPETLALVEDIRRQRSAGETPAPGSKETAPDQSLQRRLAAILAADVVGYSRLMEQDSTGTVAA